MMAELGQIKATSNVYTALLGMAIVGLLLGVGYAAFRHEEVIGTWIPFGNVLLDL